MFKEAPSKRSKHVSSGGPFKYNHDAENHSPLHIHRFFGGKTGKTIVKLQFLILRPGCFPFSCLFLRAFSPSHMVPERPPPRLKEKKQYPARNHIFYHIVVDIQTFTPPPKKRRFSCRQFLWFSHWFKAPFRGILQCFFAPEAGVPRCLLVELLRGPITKGARNQWGRWSSNFL